jgi:hypothetical protein
MAFEGLTNTRIVVALEPNRTLVMPSSYSLLTGRSFDPRSDLWPQASVEENLGLPSAAGCGRQDPTGDPYAEPEPPATVSPAVSPAGRGADDFMLQTRQFHDLRSRVAAEV